MAEDKPRPDLTVPEESGGDKAHRIGKVIAGGAAGLIAVASGGLAAALAAGGAQAMVELFFSNPLDGRRDVWLQQVSQAIEEIQMRQAEEDPARLVERLSSDPEFITTLHQATAVASRTHQEEKLLALRSAVINSALPGAPEMDIRSVFLRLIDDLSPTHLRILGVCNDPLPALEGANGLSALSRRSSSISLGQLLESALPDLRGKPWQVFSQHLITETLLNSSAEPAEATWFDTLLPHTTDFGRHFLEFVCVTEETQDEEEVVERVAVLEQLRAELSTRGRVQRFDVAPIRKVAIQKGHTPVVTDIAVRFPREAARRPVANGNPPCLAEARLSVLTASVVEVFTFGSQPELLGAERVDIQFDGGYVVNGNPYKEASGAADALVDLLEGVFPNRRFWR